MKKYWILLLVVTITLTSAPTAMAKCLRCKIAIQGCAEFATGYEYCEWTWDNNCIQHTACGALLAAPSESLAAEFTVASVERLDEPHAAASETLAASLETPAPVTPR